MAFDFPLNPAPGTIYTSPDGLTTYEWSGYAWMMGTSGLGAGGGAPSDYVLKAGDTMGGFLTLAADPALPMHAATKDYVDNTGSGGMPLPGGTNGQALVTQGGAAVWGAPIEGGNF